MFPAEVEFNKVSDGPLIFHPLESGEFTLCIANDLISLPKTDLISQGLCIDQTVISSIPDIQTTYLHKQHLLVATEYEVKLYCVRPWKDKKTIYQSSDIIRSLCLQNDGYAAIGTDSSLINMFNISNPTFAVQLTGHKNAVTGLEFAPDGQVLMSLSCDGTMRVWAKSMRSDSWDCIHSFNSTIKKFRPEESRFPFLWNPTGLYGCVANADGDVEVFENITWDTKLKIKTQGEVCAMQFSPNGLYLALVEGKILSCWMIFEGRPTLARREKHSTNLTGIAWHPKKNDLILADESGELIYFANFIPSEQQDPLKLIQDLPFLQETFVQPNEKDLFGEDEDMAPFADLDAIEEKLESKTSPNPFRKQPIQKKDMDDNPDEYDDADEIADFIEDDDGGGYMEDITKERNVEVYHRRTLKDSLGHIISKYSKDDMGLNASEIAAGSHQEVQQSFQPGSCAPQGKKQYLTLNMIGTVCVVESGLQYTVDVTFHDVLQRQFHFSGHNHYKMAALAASGLVCASECTTSLPSSVFYRPLNNWTQNSDWSVTLNEGENCVAVALSKNHVIVATDYQYLRFFATSGLQQGIKSVPGPLVSMTADENNILFVVFHQSGAFHGNQSLGYFLLEMSTGAMVREGSLPISPLSTLKWIGFSRNGVPLTFDSEGTLRGLYYHSTTLWTPLFDSRIFRGVRNDVYWPVGAEDGLYYCVICKGREEPEFPNPLITDLPLSIPFCQLESERTKLEQSATLGRLNLFQHKGSASNPDRAMLQSILQKENELDKIALQLFLGACKNELSERAIDISSYFNSLKCFDGAIKLASANQLSVLAERLGQIKQLKINADNESTDRSYIEQNSLQETFPNSERQDYPRFSHIMEDMPMSVAPKSRPRITDDEGGDDDDKPMDIVPESQGPASSESKKKLDQLESRSKVPKVKGNPFAKKKPDPSIIKNLFSSVNSKDVEPEKKKRRTALTDFIIRSQGPEKPVPSPNEEENPPKLKENSHSANSDETTPDGSVQGNGTEENVLKVTNLPASSSNNIKPRSSSLLDHFKFQPKEEQPLGGAEANENGDEKENNSKIENLVSKGKLPVNPRDRNIVL